MENSSISRNGILLHRAVDINSIFDALTGKLSWVDAIMIGEYITQPELEFSYEARHFTNYNEFRNTVLESSKKYIEHASSLNLQAMYELGY